MTARQFPLFLSVLCCLSPACGSSDPRPLATARPAAADAGDPLVEALACDALAEPMTLNSIDEAWAGTDPVLDDGWLSYMDIMQLYTAQYFAERGDVEPCATYVEEGDTVTARGDCADPDGLAFQGAMTVTQHDTVYESTWEDLSTIDDYLVISGDGTFRYEELMEYHAAIAVQADRSWTLIGDEALDGSFVVHIEGALGMAGDVLSGWVVAAGSPRVPDGQLCFAMTGPSDLFIAVGGRRSEADASAEARFLFQGDRLWEQTYGLTADGSHCTTIAADGEVVEDTCD